MKRVLAIVLGLVLLTSNMAYAGQADAFVIDASNTARGYFTVKYTETNQAKIKVMVEKNGSQYTYTFDNTREIENFPLQMGQGCYKVTLYENVGGSSYRAVISKSLKVSLTDTNQPFLQSIQSIEWNESMKAIIKAKELTAGLKSDAEKVEAIYNYVVNNMKYDYKKKDRIPTCYVPNMDELFQAGAGICYDFSSVMAGMLRSVGVPAKLVKGYSKTTTLYHSWNEVYLDGKWIILDTSYDSQMNVYEKPYTMAKDASWYDKKFEY